MNWTCLFITGFAVGSIVSALLIWATFRAAALADKIVRNYSKADKPKIIYDLTPPQSGTCAGCGKQMDQCRCN